MRLSDKNIAVLMAAANQSDPEAIGYGDILLMGCEIQERRAADPVLADRLPDVLPDELTNTTVMEGLIKRVQAGEHMLDRHVLGLFNAWRKQGFFQTITFVDSQALESVLNAVDCIPHHPHIINELAATRNLPRVEGDRLNPIDQLVKDANEANLNAAT